MAGPILDFCCCCMPLRIGSIVSGISGILLSVASLVLMFVTSIEFKTIVLDWLPTNVVKIILAINLCMTILISILLIVGACIRNHYFMMPWVVLAIMLVIGLLVSVIYTAVVCFIDGKTLSGGLWLGIGLISVVIFLYMWIVVYSHFTVLREENDRGLYSRQPYRR